MILHASHHTDTICYQRLASIDKKSMVFMHSNDLSHLYIAMNALKLRASCRASSGTAEGSISLRAEQYSAASRANNPCSISPRPVSVFRTLHMNRRSDTAAQLVSPDGKGEVRNAYVAADIAAPNP